MKLIVKVPFLPYTLIVAYLKTLSSVLVVKSLKSRENGRKLANLGILKINKITLKMEENKVINDQNNEQPFDSHSAGSGQAAQGKLKELELKCDEYLNNWKRSAADFINYKKDEMERMAVLLNYSKEDMIEKILPILDNIYLSGKQLPENLKKGEKGNPQAIEWTKGFLQIQKQIEDFLKKEGIEEIKTVGEKFNPETMETLGEISNSQFPIPNTVVEELQKGYIINGKVLRPAKVKVSK